MWILDFLLERPQRVCVNGCLSDYVCISTDPHQGCVLSPLLFILYTNNCKSDRENIFLIQFSDDIAVVSLLFGGQNDHGPAVSDSVNWCDDSYLCLNVSKTKDLCIDFRRKGTQLDPTVIRSETVESVDHYEYLGTTIDYNHTFSKKCDIIFRKGQQRLQFRRKLRSFNFDQTILTRVYISFIQIECSYLLNYMLVWQSKCEIMYVVFIACQVELS